MYFLLEGIVIICVPNITYTRDAQARSVPASPASTLVLGSRITRKVPIAVVDRRRTHVQVADHDDLTPGSDQPANALLQHQVVVHLVRKARVGPFVRAVQVDQHKQAKVEHEHASLKVQREEVVRRLLVSVGDECEFVRGGVESYRTVMSVNTTTARQICVARTGLRTGKHPFATWPERLLPFILLLSRHERRLQRCRSLHRHAYRNAPQSRGRSIRAPATQDAVKPRGAHLDVLCQHYSPGLGEVATLACPLTHT